MLQRNPSPKADPEELSFQHLVCFLVQIHLPLHTMRETIEMDSVHLSLDFSRSNYKVNDLRSWNLSDLISPKGLNHCYH